VRALYIIIICYKDDFAYYDDDTLTEFSLKGISMPMPIWPEVGRFFPLANHGFNFLGQITRSSAADHCAMMGELVTLSVVVFLSLKPVRLSYRLLILVAMMLAPSFVIPFSEFVYPERSVLLWLSVLLLCLLPSSQVSAPRASAIARWSLNSLLSITKKRLLSFIVVYAMSRVLLDGDATWDQRRSWQCIAKAQAIHS